MNGPVKEALQLSVDHGAQSDMVFTKLQEDFMKPVVNIGIIIVYGIFKKRINF